MRCGDRLLIFDGGSGLRPLGNAVMRDGQRLQFDLFYSPPHLDHIVGVPFFAPCYQAHSDIRVWAGHLKPDSGIEEVLRKMMQAPLFPVPLDIFAAKTKFRDFAAGEELQPPPGITIRTGSLNHPRAATCYRPDYRGDA